MVIMLVVTTETTAVHFVNGFARHLAEKGHHVVVVADGVTPESQPLGRGRLTLLSVKMARNPRPIADVRSLWSLGRTVAKFRPDVISYATPKASLLTSVVAAALRVPHRIYQVWGLRLETVRGLGRLLLASFERITSTASTIVVANSPSLAEQYRLLGLRRHVQTIGRGSSHGVDLAKFNRSAPHPHLNTESSSFLAGKTGLVIGFVGRLHPDKGIDTLLDAMHIAGAKGVSLQLILIGPDEGAELQSQINRLPESISVHVAGESADPRPYYAAMDVLVLVSRREGFPNVVLEAAAMSVPAIVSDATGTRDAVVDGDTGLIVPTDDPSSLAAALIDLDAHRAKVTRLGLQARTFVETHFAQADVWEQYSALFERTTRTHTLN